IPFDTASDGEMDPRESDALNRLIERISDSLITGVVRSDQYAVVNRTQQVHFDQERALLRSSDVSPSEASRLGRKLGADVMLVGKFHQFRLSEEEQEFYDSKRLRFEGAAEVHYSLIETATEKLLWSDTFHYDTEMNKGEPSYPGAKSDKHRAERFISGFVNALSERLLARLLRRDNTAPPPPPAAPVQPARELSPGSSDKPFKWE
ncbi:MAG: hypothetical protein FD130_1847, partial [Halothiobacillaceae bacterium]